MFRKFKEYFEYKKNKKIVKKELATMAATALPTIRKFTEKRADTLKFIQNLVSSTKNMKNEELVSMVLDEMADKLATDQKRIIEILTYMASLSPQDIQKVLVHSMVETMPNNESDM